MRIVVCIKQVPSSTKVNIDPETKTLMRGGVGAMINPFDEFAIEEGVRLAEKHGGECIALTMGPPQATDILRTALEQGCDRGYLASDRAFAGSDTLATSRTLASAIRTIEKRNGPVDLVICGQQAIDGDTGQVGPSLAVRMNLPPLSYVSKVREVDLEKRTIIVERQLERGTQVVRSGLPAVLTVVKGINLPRFPSLLAKRKARVRPVEKLTMADLDITEADTGLKGSPTRVVKIFAPEERKIASVVYTGDPKESAGKLALDLVKLLGRGSAS